MKHQAISVDWGSHEFRPEKQAEGTPRNAARITDPENAISNEKGICFDTMKRYVTIGPAQTMSWNVSYCEDNYVKI
jgi:hypothetical protein